MKTRQDAWTEEDDLLLAETLLRHIREGSTQLNAFEEVGDILNRTSAACGFRWNAVVRHSFETDLKISRKFWKDTQRALSGKTSKKKPLYEPSTPLIAFAEPPLSRTFNPETGEIIDTDTKDTYPDIMPETTVSTPVAKAITIHDVVSFVQSLHSRHQSGSILQQENIHLKHENDRIKMKNAELADRINQLESDSNNIQEDYETIMKIMNRARKMVLFDDEEQVSSTFKMDRNGNLERMAE